MNNPSNTVESLYKRHVGTEKMSPIRYVSNMESVIPLAALGWDRRKRRLYRNVDIIERPYKEIRLYFNTPPEGLSIKE